MTKPFIIQSMSGNQQCQVVGLAAGWVVFGAAAAWMIVSGYWIGATLFMVLVPALRWALYHFFPAVSRWLGYGRVDIDQIPKAVARAPVTVKFYSFFSCPFCPIVLHRLEALQARMGFHLERIDVTFNPRLLVGKGIRSVPVVEVGDRHLVGNVTTEQLSGFIGAAQV